MRHRPRRLRRTPAIRALVRETELTAAHLIQPLFVVHGAGVAREIPSLPGVRHLSVAADVASAVQVAALREIDRKK
jgi:porphobilinogen synthase